MTEIAASLLAAWPYREAAEVLKRAGDRAVDRPLVFETGYGPSGLPHLGTFAEVVRTSFVRQALEEVSGRATRLITFSDDMDGLRKVPDNVPHAERSLVLAREVEVDEPRARADGEDDRAEHVGPGLDADARDLAQRGGDLRDEIAVAVGGDVLAGVDADDEGDGNPSEPAPTAG